VIVLDTDILIVDMRFPGDVRYPVNRRFLDHASQTGLPLIITVQTLLEVVGKCSFNVPQTEIVQLAARIPIQYDLKVLPDTATKPEYAGCTIAEVLVRIEQRMSLGDAVNAVQIVKYIPAANCRLTWNARHYQGRLAIPVLTPEEWWQVTVPTP
jgi:hypothetical protein